MLLLLLLRGEALPGALALLLLLLLPFVPPASRECRGGAVRRLLASPVPAASLLAGAAARLPPSAEDGPAVHASVALGAVAPAVAAPASAT